MKIIAGIVTFNPIVSRLIENINAINNQVEKIIIVDNASENLSEFINLFDEGKNIDLIRNADNKGIATALNQIMEYAQRNGYTWSLLLDQDSIVPSNLMMEYKNVLLTSNVPNIGILTPKIYDLNSLKNNFNDEKDYIFVEKAITSGSLNLINSWEKVGKFDEKLFIDGVDFDYCYRLRKENYSILKVNTVTLFHEIGKRKQKKFFGWKIESLNHSAFRKFYIGRNIAYLDRKHIGTITLKTLLRLAKQIFLITLIEDNKIEKIRKLLKGFKQGCKI